MPSGISNIYSCNEHSRIERKRRANRGSSHWLLYVIGEEILLANYWRTHIIIDWQYGQSPY